MKGTSLISTYVHHGRNVHLVTCIRKPRSRMRALASKSNETTYSYHIGFVRTRTGYRVTYVIKR
jgi:hypothetical protein